jgi:hypothetical protein
VAVRYRSLLGMQELTERVNLAHGLTPDSLHEAVITVKAGIRPNRVWMPD